MDNIEFQSRAEEVDRLVQRVSALEDQEASSTALLRSCAGVEAKR